MNKKLLSTAALASLLAITANSAYAQMPPPPNEFGGHQGPHGQNMISPQERQQKITEFETRLKLTDEQKAAIEKNRAASKKKLDAIRNKEMKLHEEKRAIHEQNKKDFESLLTPAQKEELKKIEAEHAEKMREQFKNRQQQTQQNQQKKK